MIEVNVAFAIVVGGLYLARWWRLTSDASRSITGAAGGFHGRTVTIVNVGSFNIVLEHSDAGSAVGNRFINSTGLDITLVPFESADLLYDATSLVWWVSKR